MTGGKLCDHGGWLLILVDGRINRVKICVEGLSRYVICVGEETNGAKWRLSRKMA